jgi:hypothetical protein
MIQRENKIDNRSRRCGGPFITIEFGWKAPSAAKRRKFSKKTLQGSRAEPIRPARSKRTEPFVIRKAIRRQREMTDLTAAARDKLPHFFNFFCRLWPKSLEVLVI